MKTPLNLSVEEMQTLNAVIASLSERTKYQLSLEYLLDRWKQFVIRTEQEYDDSIYEYINDLSTRDVLEDVLLNVPNSIAEKLVQLIEPWDRRFSAATREIRHPLSPSPPQKSLAPWWFRIPKNPGEELKNDLRSEGFC